MFDELGNEKVFWEDAYGNIEQVRERHRTGSFFAIYEYDADQRPVRITDHLGNSITTVWDTLGRKLETCDPSGGCWTSRYDDGGLLIERTDARKQAAAGLPDRRW